MYALCWLIFLIALCGFDSAEIRIGESIDIVSPNRPYNYPDNLYCTWVFSAEDETGSFVIHFLTFDTQSKYDPLTIGRGNKSLAETVLQTFSSWIPANVTAIIEEKEIWVTFQSDFTRSGRGFELNIERINAKGTKTVTNLLKLCKQPGFEA